MQKMHVRLFHFSPSFAVIAVRACRDDIRPQVRASHVARDHMVHCQPAVALPAILAGIIITSEDFPSRQFDVRPRSMNLTLEPDDRGTRDQLSHGSDVTAPVHDHTGFTRQEQAHRASCRTDIDGFKIGI